MKTIILAASVAAMLATGAFAQTANHNPAIKDSSPAQSRVAANGSNSFTEEQARGRLTDAGYTNVTGLMKDKQGVWRGSAVKSGAAVKVGLDYKGNVVTR